MKLLLLIVLLVGISPFILWGLILFTYLWIEAWLGIKELFK